MAFEGQQLRIDRKAGADLSAAGNQYKFVKLDANGDVIMPTAATDVAIGVLQNRPGLGQTAETVFVGVTKIQGDAALAVGAVIGTSADGQAAAKTVSGAVGVMITAVGAAGEIGTAIINCASQTTA